MLIREYLSTINRIDANTLRVMPGELIEGKPSMSHVAGTRVPAINLTQAPRRPKRTVFATTERELNSSRSIEGSP
uniref:SFRICE_010613 n=1 Tax=Spodoptera frugiperda TaxID=7108 RepID=A0A2H1V963_SPOFR